MKKFALLIVSTLLLILSGCGGGGGDADGNRPVPVTNVTTSVVSFETSGNRFHSLLNMSAEKLPKDVKVKLNNFSVNLLNGCSVSNVTFNGMSDTTLEFNSVGETHTVTMDGDFNCPSPTDIYSKDVQMNYDKWIMNSDGSSERGPFPVSVNLGNPDPGEGSGEGTYKLYPDEKLTVQKSEMTYNINVAVSVTDVNGTHPATDTKVSANFLQPMFGSLENYTVTTNSDGIAKFIYHSPKNIQNLSDTYISFYRYDNPNKTEKTQLVFDPQLEDGVARMYLMPQSVQVSTPNAEQNITIITVNSRNVGVSAPVELEQLINGDGNDYGKFSTTQIQTDATGIGTVVYTAPDSISGQPSRTITVTEKNNNIQKQLTFNYLAPEQGVTSYQITVDTPKTIAVEQNGSIAIVIHEKDNPNKLIPDENVKNVTISIEGYEKMLSFTNGSGNTYSYAEEATKSVGVTTKTIAGVAIMEVEATIYNGKEDVKITSTVPLTIMSGPISSISLNYISTKTDDTENSLFYDYYNVHAVDKYANPANPGDKFYPTIICGGNMDNSKAAGTIIPTDPEKGNATISTANSATVFTDSLNKPFNKVDLTRDRLIVLPSVQASKKDYIGGWSIADVNSNESLTLKEEYYAAQTTGLRYIVGDEDRLLNTEVHVAHVEADDGSSDYTIGENGTAKIRVTYDPTLVGHTYSIAVTSYGDKERTGTAIRDNFKGKDADNGYVSGAKVSVPNGGSTDIVYTIAIVTPTGATVWLDNVDLVPSSFTVDPITKCSIDFANSNFHIDRGGVELRISANDPESTDPTIECTVSWVNNNSGIYYEY